MKKNILILPLILTLVFPAFSKVSNARAKELAKENKIDITITVSKEVNAYARLDGSILFTQGILDHKDLDESGFLLVLFHEKTHVEKNHVEKFNKLLQILIFVRSFIKEDAYSDSLVLTQVNEALLSILNSFSRTQENEADAGSFEKLKELGKDAKACELFNTVLKEPNRKLTRFDTHPASIDRFKNCTAILAKS